MMFSKRAVFPTLKLRAKRALKLNIISQRIDDVYLSINQSRLTCQPQEPQQFSLQLQARLQVVSNFGDGDCGADKIHTRARIFEETRREGSFARACVFRPRHNRHRQNQRLLAVYSKQKRRAFLIMQLGSQTNFRCCNCCRDISVFALVITEGCSYERIKPWPVLASILLR